MKKLLPEFAVIVSFFLMTPSFAWDYDVIFGSTVTPGQTAEHHKDPCSAGIGDNDGSIGACAPTASAESVAESPCNLVDDFGDKTGTWICPRPLGDGNSEGLYAAQ